jgi:hypothetical protein
VERLGRVVTLTMRIRYVDASVRHTYVALTELGHWARLRLVSHSGRMARVVGLANAWDLGALRHGSTLTLRVRLVAKDAGTHALGVLVSHQVTALTGYTGRSVQADDGGYAQMTVSVAPPRITRP